MNPAPLAAAPLAVNALESATVVVSIALLPLALSLVWAFAAARVRAGREPRSAWRASIAEVGMVAGTLPWLLLVLTPREGAGAVQLIPLVDLAELAAADPRTIVEQLVGNLILFAAAAGCFAPIRFPIGLGTVALWAALGCTAVEAAQYLFGTGRVASVDDILLNTLGAVLAALASRRWWRASREPNDASAAVQDAVLSSVLSRLARTFSKFPVARTGQLVVEGELPRTFAGGAPPGSGTANLLLRSNAWAAVITRPGAVHTCPSASSSSEPSSPSSTRPGSSIWPATSKLQASNSSRPVRPRPASPRPASR